MPVVKLPLRRVAVLMLMLLAGCVSMTDSKSTNRPPVEAVAPLAACEVLLVTLTYDLASVKPNLNLC